MALKYNEYAPPPTLVIPNQYRVIKFVEDFDEGRAVYPLSCDISSDGAGFLVTITQEDIDDGIKKNCSLCPLALAIKRTYGEEFDLDEVRVYRDRVSITSKGDITAMEKVLRKKPTSGCAPTVGVR